MFDCHLDMTKQLNSVSRSCYFHLRNIRAIRHLIPDTAAAQLVHSLISSRLDYCNSLLAGLPDTELSRLQGVLNNAARVIFRKSKRDHVTPLLKQLHWLPITARIDYKLATLAFKHFHKTLPTYLTNTLHTYHYQPGRDLRSSRQKLLDLPRLTPNLTESALSVSKLPLCGILSLLTSVTPPPCPLLNQN